MAANTTGTTNTAIGDGAMAANTTAGFSTAVGYDALKTQTIGGGSFGNNTAIGSSSLQLATGDQNTAVGTGSGADVSTGDNNTIIGYNTGRGITTGSNNTIIGALLSGLSSSLANNIIIADGAGNRRINVDASGRVGIGTNTPSTAALLDVTSTTGGVLFPRMTGTQRDAISTPPDGLVIYNTTTNKLQVRAASAWVDLH